MGPGGPRLVVGYVGPLVGSQALGQWGSGFVLALSWLPEVREVDVFCPRPSPDHRDEAPAYPPNVTVREAYGLDHASSLWGLMRRLRDWHGDLLIFSSNTTAYGRESLPNVFGLLLPVLASRLLRRRTVLVYHSSVLTSDVQRLGYTSRFDRLRESVACRLEGWVFGVVPTFVLLKMYRDRLAERLRSTKIRFFPNEFLEAIPTIYLNGLEQSPPPRPAQPRTTLPTVLLHGFWGPQKDLEGALRTLQDEKVRGLAFRLVLSGSVNPHFPGYAPRLSSLCSEYRELISEREPHPSEGRMASLLAGSDVLILPYHASGGQSGVMEMASAFDLPTICVDFPEYREKARTKSCVTLVPADALGTALRAVLGGQPRSADRDPHTREKLRIARDYVSAFLKSAQEAG